MFFGEVPSEGILQLIGLGSNRRLSFRKKGPSYGFALLTGNGISARYSTIKAASFFGGWGGVGVDRDRSAGVALTCAWSRLVRGGGGG